jgi:GntP family gluconate:H+ symporter
VAARPAGHRVGGRAGSVSPLLILLLGMAVVIGGIVGLRVNAFLALIAGALLVSLLAPGETAGKVVRVVEAFGRTAGSIGIVIALAAVIGKAMMDSGAADRVVRSFLRLLGEDRAAMALMGSGLVLAIPVFFDTVFYLLVPLARSMRRRTGRQYLKYLMAIAAGGAAAHALVPPTPGPLVVAEMLGVDLGLMLLVGLTAAVPAAAVGMVFSGWADRRMPVPLREDAPGVPESAGTTSGPEGLPPLFTSALPILLPVLLISANTFAGMLPEGSASGLVAVLAIVGNPNLALLASAAIAIAVYVRQRGASRSETAAMVEVGLMSGGVIILITAAGGAFGAMLQAADVGPAIEGLFASGQGAGLTYLFLAFGVASLLKFAQGSSTVAMITAAGMMAAMLESSASLPFHPVYVCTAIAGGSLVGSWMNDSGFWIFTKMGGLTETEALRSWSPLLALLGTTAMVVTVILALVLPLA